MYRILEAHPSITITGPPKARQHKQLHLVDSASLSDYLRLQPLQNPLQDWPSHGRDSRHFVCHRILLKLQLKLKLLRHYASSLWPKAGSNNSANASSTS